MRIVTLFILIILGISLVGAFVVNVFIFKAPQNDSPLERFILPIDFTKDQVGEKLVQEGFIKNPKIFYLIVRLRGDLDRIEPGGYKISKSMGIWKIINVLYSGPYMKWVVVPEGLRKEEIGDIFSSKLGWSEEEEKEWVAATQNTNPLYIEGVYFPDTYLVSREESPSKIAERLIANFNEKFTPYSKKALEQNIKWNTLLKLASIIQREAAGKDDMPLIAGILWNRLLDGNKLQVDATLQYARGKVDGEWWTPASSSDKNIDSPYNTYLHKGLPPTPIANPGVNAIAAVLNPTKTNCLYYLHDESKNIHCSKTYAEHLENIEIYLK